MDVICLLAGRAGQFQQSSLLLCNHLCCSVEGVGAVLASPSDSSSSDLGCAMSDAQVCNCSIPAPSHFRFWVLVPCSIKKNLQSNALTPAELLRYFKQPVEGTRAAVRAADYLHTTLSLLKERLQWAVRGDFNVTGGIPLCQEEGRGGTHRAWSLGLGRREGKGVVMGCDKSLPCGCSEGKLSYFSVLFFPIFNIIWGFFS